VRCSAARLARLVGDTALIDHVLAGLAGFTAPDWEQEDDITLVTLHRRGPTGGDREATGT